MEVLANKVHVSVDAAAWRWSGVSRQRSMVSGRYWLWTHCRLTLLSCCCCYDDNIVGAFPHPANAPVIPLCLSVMLLFLSDVNPPPPSAHSPFFVAKFSVWSAVSQAVVPTKLPACLPAARICIWVQVGVACCSAAAAPTLTPLDVLFPQISGSDWGQAETTYNLYEVLFKVHKVRLRAAAAEGLRATTRVLFGRGCVDLSRCRHSSAANRSSLLIFSSGTKAHSSSVLARVKCAFELSAKERMKNHCPQSLLPACRSGSCPFVMSERALTPLLCQWPHPQLGVGSAL